MSKIGVVYLDFLLSDEELTEVEQFSKENNIDVSFFPKKSEPINAALDELVMDIIIFVRSDSVQAAMDIITISTWVHFLIAKLKAKIQNKKMKKVTLRKVEDKKINIGVKVHLMPHLLVHSF